MYEFALNPVSAFLLFLVGFPLVGMAVGFVFRICLPYLVGVAFSYLLVNALGFSTAWWAIVLLSSIWGLSILHVRQRLRKIHEDLHWSEGHYYGAFNILTFSAPLRRGKTFVRRPATSKA